MIKSKIPHGSFVRESFKRENQMGKGKIIRSDRERLTQDRCRKKTEFRKEMKRGFHDESPFFLRKINGYCA